MRIRNLKAGKQAVIKTALNDVLFYIGLTEKIIYPIIPAVITGFLLYSCICNQDKISE